MAGNPVASRIRDAGNRVENPKQGDLAQARACPQRNQGPIDCCPRAALSLRETQRRILRHGCDQKNLIAADVGEERRREYTEGPCTDGCLDHSKDRKSTRLNSSHQIISYAVFCLKKKTRTHTN